MGDPAAIEIGNMDRQLLLKRLMEVSGRYGVVTRILSDDPPDTIRVETKDGGGLGRLAVSNWKEFTADQFEMFLKGWGLRPLTGLEQMREQAKASRAARAEALVPQGATLGERRVRALERIAFALERLADGK